MIKTKPLSDKKNYFNNFTVQFFDKSLKVGDKILPLGQVCTDMLNVDLYYLKETRDKIMDTIEYFDKTIFIPDVKVDKQLTFIVRNKLNEIVKQISQLPLYEHLNIEILQDENEEPTENMVEEIKLVAIKGTELNQELLLFLLDSARIADDIVAFNCSYRSFF